MSLRVTAPNSTARVIEINEATRLLRLACLARPGQSIAQTLAAILGRGPQGVYQADETDIIEAAKAFLEKGEETMSEQETDAEVTTVETVPLTEEQLQRIIDAVNELLGESTKRATVQGLVEMHASMKREVVGRGLVRHGVKSALWVFFTILLGVFNIAGYLLGWGETLADFWICVVGLAVVVPAMTWLSVRDFRRAKKILRTPMKINVEFTHEAAEKLMDPDAI